MLNYIKCSLKTPPKFWEKRNWFAYCLSPLAFIFQTIAAIQKIKKVTRLKIPIIVVGNITVGGTGKTPLVIWLANFLRQQGFNPGIISRGYAGKAPYYPYSVTPTSNPIHTGDEALLLAQRTYCPVVIDPNRVAAAKKILADNNCNIIISDDGLQHYKLGRDIEIIVIDGEGRFGNGFCLPAGPLREPLTRLKEVDFIVTNGQPQQNEYGMQLMPGKFQQLKNQTISYPLEYFKNKTVHAVAGIGNPQRFFKLLKAMGLTIIEHPFPDHYLFKKEDFNFSKHETIVMTEKDAVICRDFAGENYWYLPVEATINKELGINLLEKIKNAT